MKKGKPSSPPHVCRVRRPVTEPEERLVVEQTPALSVVGWTCNTPLCPQRAGNRRSCGPSRTNQLGVPVVGQTLQVRLGPREGRSGRDFMPVARFRLLALGASERAVCDSRMVSWYLWGGDEQLMPPNKPPLVGLDGGWSPRTLKV